MLFFNLKTLESKGCGSLARAVRWRQGISAEVPSRGASKMLVWVLFLKGSRLKHAHTHQNTCTSGSRQDLRRGRGHLCQGISSSDLQRLPRKRH